MNEGVFNHAIKTLDLTRDQEEVLRMVCQGYTNKGIARVKKGHVSSVEQMLRLVRKTVGYEGKKGMNHRIGLVNLVWERGME